MWPIRLHRFVRISKPLLRACSSSQGSACSSSSTLLQSIIKVNEPNEIWQLLKTVDDSTLCDTMWALNNQRRHLKVVSILDVLIDQRKSIHQKGILAAINSFGSLRLPLKSKSLVTLPMLEGVKLKQSQYVATLLLDAYRAADRIDMLQDLLCSWLELHEKNTKITELKKKIITTKSNNVHSQIEGGVVDVADASGDPLKGLSKSDLSANLPSIIAWNIILSAYAERGAWIQCVSIIEFLNNNNDSIGKVNFEDYRVQSRRYSYLNHENNTSDTDSLVTGGNNDRWFIYYNTIRCLVNSKQYGLALKYIEEMKHQAKLEPSVPILSLFLKMVKSPLFDRPIDDSPGSDTTIMKILLTDIREALLVLVESVATNEASLYGHATRVLLSSYISFMLSRGLVYESEEVLEMIYNVSKDGPKCISGSTVEYMIKKLAYQSDGKNALKWFHRLARISDGKRYSTPASLSYHHVCDAFRRGKDFDKLVAFMEDPFRVNDGAAAAGAAATTVENVQSNV